MTAEADRRPARLEPLGAPTDPVRPTGPADLEHATREAKARLAARARKALLAIAIVSGCLVALAIAAICAIATAFP